MDLTRKTEGCLICGKELSYLTESVKGKCEYCGKETEALIICPDNHFVCDDCHRADGLKAIENICINSSSTDPISIANQIMNLDFIFMHGPEHHALVPAVLVTAYKNKTGLINEKHIKEAIKRGSQVQGGMCGNFGACGAGIGTGIAMSIINETTPLSQEDWGTANKMTAKALYEIGQKGGPRCCKRCSWTAIETAAKYIEEVKGVSFELTKQIGNCHHFRRNKQCQGIKCSYFPKGRKGE